MLQQRGIIRFTPAGLPMLDTRVLHRSSQSQQSVSGAVANRTMAPRQVEFELAALFAGALATRADLLEIGTTLELDGFLAPRRQASKTLVLQVTDFTVIEAVVDAAVADETNTNRMA